MVCPHCTASNTHELAKRTQLGYRLFRCSRCRRQFNERTSTPSNYLECPTASVRQVVLWRLRYTLSLRDRADMLFVRGCVFTHAAVRDWEAQFAPVRTTTLRSNRKGHGGTSWHVDEPSIKVGGGWKYRYRATLRAGNLIDARLSEHRDMDAAQPFFMNA